MATQNEEQRRSYHDIKTSTERYVFTVVTFWLSVDAPVTVFTGFLARQGCEVLSSACLYVRLFVCLSTRISQKPHVQIPRTFLCVFFVAVILSRRSKHGHVYVRLWSCLTCMKWDIPVSSTMQMAMMICCRTRWTVTSSSSVSNCRWCCVLPNQQVTFRTCTFNIRHRSRYQLLLPPIDSTRAAMIVWRLGGKLLRTVLCCIVYDSHAQWYSHTRVNSNCKIWMLAYV